MFLRDPSKYTYKTENIILGEAELFAITVKGKQGWSLPGGQVVYDRSTAMRMAAHLDGLIRYNKFKRMPKRPYL